MRDEFNDRPVWCRKCTEPIDDSTASIRFCKVCGREGCEYCIPDGTCDECVVATEEN